MRNSTIIVPAALVLVLGGLACKKPKSQEEVQNETKAAFNDGTQAFKDGKGRDANPYLNKKEDAHKAEAWNKAWDAAKADKAAADQQAAADAAAAAQKQAADAAAAEKSAAEAEAAAKAAELSKQDTLKQAAEAALKEINFAFDRSDIRELDKAKLQAVADFLKGHADAKLQLEGHCDERGTVEYNLALGERRANSAKSYLVGLGVSEARLSTISYGKERPKVQSSDEQSWLANRRCEFKLQ